MLAAATGGDERHSGINAAALASSTSDEIWGRKACPSGDLPHLCIDLDQAGSASMRRTWLNRAYLWSALQCGPIASSLDEEHHGFWSNPQDVGDAVKSAGVH